MWNVRKQFFVVWFGSDLGCVCGGVGSGLSDDLRKVRLFKTMGEFISLSKDEMMEIDQEENVRVLPNGQFLIFLKTKSNKEENNTEFKENAATNTEK